MFADILTPRGLRYCTHINTDHQHIVLADACTPMQARGEVLWLNQHSGQLVHWQAVAGALDAAPLLAGNRLYVISSDGCLYCWDVNSAEPVHGFPARVAERCYKISAAPVLVKTQANAAVYRIVTVTQGSTNAKDDATLTFLTSQGQVLHQIQLAAKVRAAPVVHGQIVYICGYTNYPQHGRIFAYDVRNGMSVWAAPFEVTASDPRAECGFHTSPLLLGAGNTPTLRLLAGNANGDLYCLDPANGHALGPAIRLGYAVTAAPVSLADAIVAVGCNDGCAYVFEVAAANAMLLVQLGTVNLPGRRSVRGLALGPVVAGDVASPYLQLTSAAGSAQHSWQVWATPNNRAALAEAFARAGDAADAAGNHMAPSLWQRAALGFAALDTEAAHDRACALYRRVAQALGLGWLELSVVNLPRFVIGQPEKLTLRLRNVGGSSVPVSTRLCLFGALKQAVEVTLNAALGVGALWQVTLELIASTEHSQLHIEATFGEGPLAPLCNRLRSPIEARPAPQPIYVGDTGTLNLTVHSADGAGVQFNLRDVGILKATDGLGNVNVAGDVGSLRQTRRANN